MQKIVCLACSKFFRVKRNGVYLEEGMPMQDTWGPYKLWAGDLLECPGCHVQVVSGFASKPLAEHYQDNYGEMRDRFQPLTRVDDCGGGI